MHIMFEVKLILGLRIQIWNKLNDLSHLHVYFYA